jgi:[protein-PII] uridylyltransferase
MTRVRKKRRIIDRTVLGETLDAVARRAPDRDTARSQALGILKEALAEGHAEIRRRFEYEAAPGSLVVHANAFLIDRLVRCIHDFASTRVWPETGRVPKGQLSVAATGGYGRGELAPFSDIDMMFLLAEADDGDAQHMVEFMLYLMWDLGLKVGHATRTVDEAIDLARQDMTIRTSLLEARTLWGNGRLFKQFRGRFAEEVVAGTGAGFVEAKLAERDARHDRRGDTRYVLEPNVKEGKGGLRDLQTLFWIAKYLYRVDHVRDLVDREVLTPEDARRFAKAQNFLWTVRCNLHYLTGRPEERLTFDVQAAIGERMGYTDRAGARGVERFMKHYFLVAKDVGDLTRILCAVLEEQHAKRKPLFRLPLFALRSRDIDGFKLDGERLTVETESAFTDDPVTLIRLFYEAHRNDLDIHPAALRLVSQNLGLVDRALRADAEANRLFMEILTSRKDPEIALKRLNEAGVFGRFVPDFGRVVAQMQYDMYHVYTVDEHTIRAIGILSRIERGELRDELPVSSTAITDLQSRRALYVALLLHDIAKGRDGDHSEIGAAIAQRLGPRLGLTANETETVSWLVRHHLLMSATAFKRDVEDPKTVGDFVAAVQSPERLRLLLILTVADIRAVGPDVWNGWKASLLRELFTRALEEMPGGVPAERRGRRVETARQALRDRLADWDAADVEAHIERGYPDYWLSFDTDTHVHHAHLIGKAERNQLTHHIETRADTHRGVTELIVYTADHPGLFARIAGGMALGGATIVDAKIVTLANGMALDTFSVHDHAGGAFHDDADLEKLWRRIEDALHGHLYAAHELETVQWRTATRRTGVFKVPPRVLIDNAASANHTVIEVNGRDRPGFLHAVGTALTALGLQIASARITTYGERVVDVFYVKNVFGLKVDNEERLETIRARLLEAIADSPADGPRTA